MCDPAPVYITNVHFDESSIFLIPSGATYGRYGGHTLNYDEDSVFFDVGSSNPNPAYKITGKLEIRKIEAGETTYVYSADRDAYPDSGTVDGLTYTYLGIPFDNAVTVPKVAVGSYLGTGTFGSGNPCSLTFDFAPKIVIITGQSSGLYPKDGYWSSNCFIWTYGQTTVYKYASNTTSYITCSLSGNTLSWYHGSQSIDDNKRASGQCNVSGEIYLYLVIG